MRDASSSQVISFGHDGWNGQLAREVTFDAIEAISRAAGFVLSRDDPDNARIVVGYDRRFLADEFGRAIATQLASLGIEPWLIPRPVPTPVLSYTVRSVAASAGIMVTAGSLAAGSSGIKLRADDGGPVPRAQLDEIERIVNEGAGVRPVGPTATVAETDPVDEYLAAVSRQVPVRAIQGAGITVAIDSMWGTASELLPRLTDGDGSRSVEIRTGHNPRFPDLCQPDPTERNLSRLQRTVKSGGATLGVAFGGDASRLGLIDDQGRYVSPEKVFAVVAYYLLSVKRVRGLLGRSIAMPTEVERLATELRAPVRELGFGLTEIVERLRQEDFRLAADEWGNILVPRHLPDSDAILAAMLLIACVVETGESISELVDEIDQRVGPHQFRRTVLPLTADQRALIEERIQRSELPPMLAQRAVQDVQRAFGVRLQLEGDAWILLRLDRYADTLILVAEATDSETADRLIEAGRHLMLV